MKFFNLFSFILVLLGGLNWTLIGLVDMNLFTTFFGDGMITLFMYLLVTISTVYVVFPKLMEFLHTA